jgi:hypothetical protein
MEVTQIKKIWNKKTMMLIKVMGRFNQMEIKIINLDFLRIKYEEKSVIALVR